MENAIDISGKTTKQYIVIKIGSEQYGLDISYIDNIVRMPTITRVPRVQTYFKGIINLRGEVVPVMSIRLKMHLPDDVFTDASRIIILKVEEQGSIGTIGIIVDEVKEVVELGLDEIERPAQKSKFDKGSFICGVGKHDNELISLFDINAVVDEPDNG
ncbi:MAG: chemotaxis protein CheW [Roseburia sp.]|nr:chemotaxis protein CheW [Roseburia sp.]